jgi:chloramphenicol 3-O phosphotransferase
VSARIEKPRRTILLNGPAAAGKTSLAKAIQDVMKEPYFRWGVDTFFATVPSRWAGGPRGELRHEGIFYEGDVGEGESRRVTGIGYGPVGRQMLEGMHRAFLAFAIAGNNQIIDGLFWDRALLSDFVGLFVNLEVLVVGVYCSETELARRERDRGGPYGLALGQGEKVHDDYRYDVIVDTSDSAPAECARVVTDWLALGQRPIAIRDMYRELVEP